MPIRRAYDEAAEESGSSEDIPAFTSVRSRAKRFRSKFIPPLPTDIEDVHIEDEWARTWKGERFLSHLDNDWGIAIFTTSKMLRVLQQCRRVFIDGTFRTAPHPYTQFVTIHGDLNGFVVPLVFCLTTGKTIGQYRQILQHVKQEVRRVTRRRFKPSRMVLDFEQSLMMAVETELPACRLSGCYFHFTQSLWRNLQQLGLAHAYMHDRRLQRTVRKLMAIGFLPVLLVRQNFQLLRRSRRTRRLERRYPHLVDWLDYVETNYMNSNSLFRPAVWNVYDRDIDTRTNNHVEGSSN